MQLQIVKKRNFDGAEAAVAGAYEAALPHLIAQPEFEGWPNTTVRVVLGGPEQCRAWNVASSALGFHAIAARKAEGELVVNGHHEIHLNIEAGTKAITAVMSGAGEDRTKEIELASLLVTAPQELLHVVEWLKAAGGRTPQQVFDQDGGEGGLRQIKAAVEAKSLAANHLETTAMDIVWRIMPGHIAKLTLEVVEGMAAESAPSMTT